MLSRNRELDYVSNQLDDQRAWVEIDCRAITNNVRQFKQYLAPQTELMAVVKADAYGHGAIRVAQTVLQEGATWLATATLGEGIELRKAGITAPILVLGATNTPQELAALAYWQLQPTLCNSQQAWLFSKTMATIEQNLPVHLILDTGMSRLGTAWQDAAEFVGLVERLPYLQIASVYSHLATAEDSNTAILRQQHQCFEKAIAQLRACGIVPPRLHLANSAATLGDRSVHYDLVRVGLGLYGLYPAPRFHRVIDLQPVLRVKARVTQVKTIPAHTGVSYGYKFVTDRETPVAVVGIGYADGVPRNLSNRLQVLVRGQLVPQIGAITMDQLMLDLSNHRVQPGEVVTLIGRDGDREISADDWASTLGTISWEILCGFKHRLPRVTI